MTGLIILAAGQSGRLGQPKQNLVFQGKTLLQRAIETALASACRPVIAVLGANEKVIQPTIDQYPIKISHNTAWREGIASSITLGSKEMQKEPAVTAAILMLCDQPFVNPALLNELAKRGPETGIVACAYKDTVGIPALFSSIYFEELARLKGDEGAKKLLFKHQQMVISIPFPLGGVDIDTIEDYEKLG